MPLEQTAHQVWSTADVHPRDRLSWWVDGLSSSVTHVDCEPQRDQPFFGEIFMTTAGEIRGSTYSSVAQTLARPQRKIDHRPEDSLTIGIQSAGHALGNQDGRDVVLRPGDLVLYDMSRPFQLTFRSCFVRTTLVFSRSALLRRIGAVEQFTGRRIDGSTGLGAILSPMLQRLPAGIAEVTADGRKRVAENLLDLIATTFLDAHDGERLPSGMRLVRVKLWIEAHLDEVLSPERVAGESRISIRHLNRLFEREETSLMRFVWKRRLARCHRDLNDPAMRSRTVSEIAFAAGFNNVAHFSRAYRECYGCTPRDTRTI